MTELTARELLIMLYQTALDSVDGRYLVNQFLKANQKAPYTHCVAIGKAAAAMLQGALEQTPSITQSLLICPDVKITRQLKKNKSINCVASSHPVPDEKSIVAGKCLLDFLSATTENDKILFLISGGTSALVEVLAEDVSLEQLQTINNYLLASGKNIHHINAWRQQFSQIKGGGLLNWIKAPNITQLLLSDVKDDKPEFIGSGLLVDTVTETDGDEFLLSQSKNNRAPVNKNAVKVNTHIIGNINVAIQAVNAAAQNQNLDSFIYDEFLEGDVMDVVEKLYDVLKEAKPGIHIWGGETTVQLPQKPGVGGRNLTLALAFSQYLCDDTSLHLLAAGTDGVDGNTKSAGAIASTYTYHKAGKMGFDIQQEIKKANAGIVLMATDDLVNAESNTNVMDIVIAYKLAT